MERNRAMCSGWLYWFIFCGVALLSLFFVYGHSLQFFFWSDDFYLLEYVDQNPFSEYVRVSFTKPTERLPLNFGFHFRPVSQYIKFKVARLLFDLNPLPYRLWLIMFQHFLLGVLIAQYSQMITRKPMVGFVAGVLFVINRIHLTAIYWVIASSANLSVCFVLLSVIAYLQALKQVRKSWIHFWISYVSLALALLSDVVAVVVPVLVALSVFLRLDNKSFRDRLFACLELWPHVLMVLVFLAIRAPLIVYALGGGGDSYYRTSNLSQIALRYLWGFWWHLETFVEPWRTILDGLTQSFSLFQPVYLSATGMILTIAGAIWLIRVSNKANATNPIWLGLVWFFVSASPALAAGVLTDYPFSLSAVGFVMVVAYLVEFAVAGISRESAAIRRLLLVIFLVLSVFSARFLVLSLEKTTWPVKDMTLAAEILEVAQHRLLDSDETVCLVDFPDEGLTLAYIDEAFRLFVDPEISVRKLTAVELEGGGCSPSSLQLRHINGEIVVYQPSTEGQRQ